MEMIKTFLYSPAGAAIITIVAVIVGFWLREWTYDNRHESRKCWNATEGADLKREEKERKRFRKQTRKKYAYLNENGNKSSKGSIGSNKSNGNNDNNDNTI